MAFNKLANFFGLNYDDEVEAQEMPAKTQAPVNNSNVVAINSKAHQQPRSEIRIVEPRSYSAAKEIAKDLMNRKSVLVNFKNVGDDQMRRISDFLSGTIYAIKGSMKQVDKNVILFAASNFDIDSAFSSDLTE